VAAMSQPISPALVSQQASVPANTLWKAHNVPFLAVPPEIHLRIFQYLNPVDATCLSLVRCAISPFHSYLESLIPEEQTDSLQPLRSGCLPEHYPSPLSSVRSANWSAR
jgi:hypothetical protein